MDDIIDYCNSNPCDYTYLGIGSKNRYDDIEKLTPDLDQILPPFLDKVKTRIRCIHVDPRFSEDTGFLKAYFALKKFKKYYGSWVSQDNRIEVIIVCEFFQNNDILRKLIDQTIEHKTQLVVQQYTGAQLISVFKMLYSNFSASEQEYIRNNVLFDITYGADCSCMTPMTQYEPLMDHRGCFYNFTLYNETQIIGSIGLHPKMDILIKQYVTAKLSQILNEDHVNYRKATRNETLMFPSSDYDVGATADMIMSVLLNKVKVILGILKRLGSLTQEKQDLFNKYSQNYKSMDMYTWYSDMTKLYK